MWEYRDTETFLKESQIGDVIPSYGSTMKKRQTMITVSDDKELSVKFVNIHCYQYRFHKFIVFHSSF